MKTNMMITAAVVAIAAMFLAVFKHHRASKDEFQICVAKLVKRRSGQDIRDAQSAILKMGPSVVGRLLSTLDTVTNTLTQDEIYTACSHGGLSSLHNARPTLAREDIYSLISTLDVDSYRRMVLESCQTNSAELCMILSGANCETLLTLPDTELFNLTNTVAVTMTGASVDPREKWCGENFLGRLQFAQKQRDQPSSRFNLTNE
jgi:hypothetical protein